MGHSNSVCVLSHRSLASAHSFLGRYIVWLEGLCATSTHVAARLVKFFSAGLRGACTFLPSAATPNHPQHEPARLQVFVGFLGHFAGSLSAPTVRETVELMRPRVVQRMRNKCPPFVSKWTIG